MSRVEHPGLYRFHLRREPISLPRHAKSYDSAVGARMTGRGTRFFEGGILSLTRYAASTWRSLIRENGVDDASSENSAAGAG
jgi:hypothetical protein